MECTESLSEQSPGIIVERRQLLRLAGLGSLLAFAPTAVGEEREPAAEDRTFHRFTESWRELTDRRLGPDSPREEAYMYELAGRLSGLSLAAVPPMQRKVFSNERITSGPAYIDTEIFIVVLRMEPGALLMPHNHPDHIVATACLEGSCQFRHFEAPSAPQASDLETEFQVRETRRGVMRPGDISHLTRMRDNIHSFQAGEKGAVLLDFTIERSKGGSFGMLDVATEPDDPFLRTFPAHWTEVEF